MRMHSIVFLPLVLFFSGQTQAEGHDKTELAQLLSGNTMIITNKSGPASVYFDPSGVFRMSSLDRVISEGKWRATADSVCSTTNPTPEGEVFPEYCMDMKGRGLNDSWSAEDPKNGKILFKLVRGTVRSVQ